MTDRRPERVGHGRYSRSDPEEDQLTDEGQTLVVITDIADLLHRHWGFVAADVRPLGGGMNSETWLVTHAGATYVAKRVAPSDLPQLAAGCDIAARLAEAGLVTGAPVLTQDGRLVVADHALALLEFVPGRELDGRPDEEQRWIAHTLSRVHSLGGPASELGTGTFFEWLTPDATGVDASRGWQQRSPPSAPRPTR